MREHHARAVVISVARVTEIAPHPVAAGRHQSALMTHRLALRKVIVTDIAP